jgi:hypothetical protein
VGRNTCAFYNSSRVGDLMECTACPPTRLAQNTPGVAPNPTDMYSYLKPDRNLPERWCHGGVRLHPSLVVFAAHQPGDDPTVVSKRSRGGESYRGTSYCSGRFFPWRARSFDWCSMSAGKRNPKGGEPAHHGWNPTPNSERAALN